MVFKNSDPDAQKHQDNASNAKRKVKNKKKLTRAHRRSGLPEHLIMYIPENMDLDELISKHPPKIPNFEKDKLVYIVHLIYDIQIRNKDKNYDGGVPINANILQKRIYNYRKYLDYLVDNKIGVLLEAKQFITGKKSRRFRFAPEYKTKIKEVKVSDYILIKNVLKHRKNLGLGVKKDISPPKLHEVFYLSKWYNEMLTIDINGVEEFLEERRVEEMFQQNLFDPMFRFNTRLIPAKKINRGEFNTMFDTTAGRFHSTLTQLMGDLRQYLRYNGRVLHSIDIVNSQPFLACALLSKDLLEKNRLLDTIGIYNTNYKKKPSSDYLLYYSVKNDTKKMRIKKFTKAVKSGKFYEKFGNELNKKGLLPQGIDSREEAKKCVFRTIFDRNRAINYLDEMKLFRAIYPGVYEIFKAIKKGDGNHRTLACTLQNLEAELILHRVCKLIHDHDETIPMFTIHDSIATFPEHIAFVKETICKVMLEHIGMKPKLRIDKWE